MREAAYAALPYVTGPSHMDRLARLLDAADGQHAAQIQTALIRTSAQLPADKRYGAIAGYMQASKIPARYYPVLAQTGTPEAVASLLSDSARSDREAAFAALLTVRKPCDDRYPLPHRRRKSGSGRSRP